MNDEYRQSASVWRFILIAGYVWSIAGHVWVNALHGISHLHD
jgi:hypothetical protein